MAFKMKAGKEGPMKKNFSSVFKKDKKTIEKLRKAMGGGSSKLVNPLSPDVKNKIPPPRKQMVDPKDLGLILLKNKKK